MKDGVSTTGELKRLVGKKEFLYLQNRCPDKRDLFALAAQKLRLDETELCAVLADRLKIPAIIRLPSEFTIAPSPEFSLEECQTHGFVLFRSKGGLDGIACVDPSWLSSYGPRLDYFPKLISTWSNIKGWIEASESPPLDDFESINVPPNEPVLSGQDAVCSAIRDLESRGATSGLFSFSAGRISYQPAGKQPEPCKAEIRTDQSERVEEFFALSQLGQPIGFARQINGTRYAISVSPGLDSRSFHISWGFLPTRLERQDKPGIPAALTPVLFSTASAITLSFEALC